MRTFDARAWVVWLLAGGVLVLSARNPLYLLLLLVISRIVQAACAAPDVGARRLPFWRLAAAILIFATLFNLLTAHVGETMLATLPAGWWLIGGAPPPETAGAGVITGPRPPTPPPPFLARLPLPSHAAPHRYLCGVCGWRCQ